LTSEDADKHGPTPGLGLKEFDLIRLHSPMSRTIVKIKDRLPAGAELGQKLGMTVEQLEQFD
jgi:hypothetical protein